MNILVVDDEAFFAEWLAENLRDLPERYEAHWVSSAQAALDFIKRQPVDLVISDIKMSGRSGLELLREIRAQYPGTGVILMTGYALPQLEQQAAERGFHTLLEKPFSLQQLAEAINQAFGERALEGPPLVKQPILDSGGTVETELPTAYPVAEGIEGGGQWSGGQIEADVTDAAAVLATPGAPGHRLTGDRVEQGSPEYWPPLEALPGGDLLSAAEASDQSGERPSAAPDAGPGSPVLADSQSLVASGLSGVGNDQQLTTSSQQPPSWPPVAEQVTGDQGPVLSDELSQLLPGPSSRATEVPDRVRLGWLECLAPSEHLDGGAVLTDEGRVLASTLPATARTDAIMARTRTLLQLAGGLATDLDQGALQLLLIQSEGGRVIIVDCGGPGGGILALFVANAQSKLGLSLLQARARAQKIWSLFASG